MKKNKLFLICFVQFGLMALTGCESKNNAPVSAEESSDSVELVETKAASSVEKADSVAHDEVSTDKAIEKFVDDTFTEVYAAYAKANEQGTMLDRSVYDKKYFTKSLLKAIDDEEIIDSDYWIQAQDFSTPVFSIKDTHVTDENGGYVDIVIKVFGENSRSTSECRVVVTKEDGKWKIDDLQTKYEGEYLGWK